MVHSPRSPCPVSYLDPEQLALRPRIRSKETTHPHIASSWEELPESMKTRSHDSVRGIKCLFHSVTVVHIAIDVEHTRVYSDGSARVVALDQEKVYLSSSRMPRTLMIRHFLTNCKSCSHIIDVTESTCFSLLGVMQSSSPIYRNVCHSRIQLFSSGYGHQLSLAAVSDEGRTNRSSC